MEYSAREIIFLHIEIQIYFQLNKKHIVPTNVFFYKKKWFEMSNLFQIQLYIVNFGDSSILATEFLLNLKLLVGVCMNYLITMAHLAQENIDYHFIQKYSSQMNFLLMAYHICQIVLCLSEFVYQWILILMLIVLFYCKMNIKFNNYT